MVLTVAEAAARLGVSTRQVQNLVADGTLRRVARGLVDDASVDRLLAVRGDAHRRAWSTTTAWGAVALLSGAAAGWMGASQRSRLEQRLRQLTAGEVVERARERAQVHRYAGHPSTAVRLRAEIIHTSRAAEVLGLAGTDHVDGYVAVHALESTVARHGLIRDETGRVTLRSTGFDLGVVRDLAERSTALAALDLAESLDVRERRAGVDGLDAALERLRG